MKGDPRSNTNWDVFNPKNLEKIAGGLGISFAELVIVMSRNSLTFEDDANPTEVELEAIKKGIRR